MIPGPVRVSCPCCAVQRGEAVDPRDHMLVWNGGAERLALMFLMRVRILTMKGTDARACPTERLS